MVEVNDRDYYLSIAKIIQAVEPTRKMILTGIELPKLENESDWLRFELLGRSPLPSRKNQTNISLLFQLVCYSNESEFKDGEKKSFDTHYKLAALYTPLFNQTDYVINNTCIRFEESKIAYLDLRTSTFTAKSISTGTTPSLQTQSAVILTNGLLILNKDM